jgi:predicted ATP-dependent endonuclease of OLD family
MKINKLIIENFKSLKGIHEIDIDSNLVFLVGENNSGKTTVLEAIDYLINGPEKDSKYLSNGCDSGEFVRVEAVIEDDFLMLGEDDLKKYNKYIQEISNKKFIQIKRSTEVKKIIQGNTGKEIDLDESKIQTFLKDKNQFENPTGKDTTFKSLLDVVPVWSDTDPDDITDFGTTKILGKLINMEAKSFFNGPLYENFKKEHDKLFHTSDDSLQKKLEALSLKITEIFKNQYGDAKINFNFNLVDNSTYIKNGKLLIDEGGDQTTLDQKGSGMQRSISLSVIQLYSNLHDKNSNLIFLIDEPELSLHPKAQQKLIDALFAISDNTQVFITTHSPYSLKSFDNKKHTLLIFDKTSSKRINKINDLNIISWGPTLSEIDYFAYKIYSKELFNDLYAFLEYKVMNELSESSLEKYLYITKKIPQISYNRSDGKGGIRVENWTPLSITRHKIHHQDNQNNPQLTNKDIEDGIKDLILLIKEIV